MKRDVIEKSISLVNEEKQLKHEVLALKLTAKAFKLQDNEEKRKRYIIEAISDNWDDFRKTIPTYFTETLKSAIERKDKEIREIEIKIENL